MDNPKAQLADKLKNANNVLVTVSRNPSVDQLSAMLGMALLLNKLGKHAAAVFSGEVPSTIEFLKPEETIEKNTDSLRDFIIALDKSKADKLRYKVEDQVVRIFITPYRTSINQDDLDFSQGDFNVDVVIALGVREQQDLDEAILSHGRILHDATVATVNISSDSQLGTINWHDQGASSLSELVTDLARDMGKDLLDGQIATALLTGIVAETDRFSNEKTTSATMSVSAALMAAGANQQLVASKLEGAGGPVMALPAPGEEPAAGDDGSLSIKHAGETDEATDEAAKPEDDHLSLPEPQPEPEAVPEDDKPVESSHDPDTPVPLAGATPSKAAPLQPLSEEVTEKSEGEPEEPATPDNLSSGSKRVTEAPSRGGELTANTQPEPLDAAIDPLGAKPRDDELPLLTRKTTLEPATGEESATPQPEPSAEITSPEPQLAPAPAVPAQDPAIPAPSPFPEVPADPGHKTLADIEQDVHSPHTTQEPANPDVDSARDEVNKVLGTVPPAPAPIAALNSQPLGADLRPADTPAPAFTEALQQAIPPVPQTAAPAPEPAPPAPVVVPQPPVGSVDPGIGFDPNAFSTSPTAPSSDAPAQAPQVVDPTAPPPVPPPIPFQFGTQPPAPPKA